MPTVEDVRSRFREHVGDGRYSKFIATIQGFARHRGRLRYWQEFLWDDFVAANPDCQLSHEDLCSAFRICELHGCELQSKLVVVFDGCLDYDPDYERERLEKFPYAAPDLVSSEGRPMKSDRELIWYCHECEAIRESTRWRKSATEQDD